MAYRLRLWGRRFGRLVVNKRIDPGMKWLCVCDCGNTCSVDGRLLNKGHTQSCGCLKVDIATKHGHASRSSRSKEYNAWVDMKRRCFNKDYVQFKDYGGRGISVCPSWSDSFENFLADMGAAPAGLSLDRIDNDGDYEPSNCRWATRLQQARNKRRKH